MRLRAMFTIEASYIFVFITLLILSIISLDFLLHDRVVNDSCKIQGGIRIYEADSFYYDNKNKNIDINRIICSPVLKEEKYSEELSIYDNLKEYYTEYNLGSDLNFNTDNLTSVITVKKNAALLRKSGRVVKLIGDILDEN